MTTHFAHDMRLARRRSGLTQADCAFLIGITPFRLGAIERGVHLPTLQEFFAVSLVLDRRFDSFCAAELKAIRAHISKRLKTLPEPRRCNANMFNRELTLNRLARLIEDSSDTYDAD